MRVLLTGATGFLGRHLLAALAGQGHEVVALVRRASDPARLPHVPGLRVRAVEDGVDGLFGARGGVEAVLHAATDYGQDPARPFGPFLANVALPMRLLEQAVGSGAAFLNVDSFFNTPGVRYDHLAGYTLSKRHFQEWGEHLAGAGRVSFTNARLHHLYGPGDSPAKFVPGLVRRCLEGERIDLTAGLQERDFIHVDDAVSALLALLRAAAHAPAGYRCCDVGTGMPTAVRAFAELANRLAGSRAELRFGALPTREGEFARACADTAALRALGWQPRVALAPGIASVIEHLQRQPRP